MGCILVVAAARFLHVVVMVSALRTIKPNTSEFSNFNSIYCLIIEYSRMSILHGLWFFYQKLIIPSLVVSIVLSYFMMDRVDICAGIGISFVFLTPIFHYFIYEIRNPNEYYFYYNLGLSKITLWASTVVISFVFGLLFIML